MGQRETNGPAKAGVRGKSPRKSAEDWLGGDRGPHGRGVAPTTCWPTSAPAGLHSGPCPHQRGTLGIDPVKVLACCDHTVDVRNHLLLGSHPHLVDFLLSDACSGEEGFGQHPRLGPKLGGGDTDRGGQGSCSRGSASPGGGQTLFQAP